MSKYKISVALECVFNSGFEISLFQHEKAQSTKFEVHSEYKVQSTFSTCVNNDDDDDNDDDDNNDDKDNNYNKAGEIIPILNFTLVFLFLLVKNEAVILLDLEIVQYFRLSRCQMCRPYIAFFFNLFEQ